METIVLDMNNEEHIKLCAGTIKSGGVVAVPTETVYGLGANALDEAAVQEIFKIKGRQSDNPLIVHVASIEEIEPLVDDIPEIFIPLAAAFWPGPLTLVMKKSDIIPDNVTAGLDTVAIRIPEHPAALALIRACGKPIAAPSANPSGRPSPTKAIHVIHDLDGKIPYILNGGDCRVGLESTVLDISDKVPKVLRPGGVILDELRAVIKNIGVEGSIANAAEPNAPRSPGMKYRHYAPKAPLTAVLGSPDESAMYIKEKMSNTTAALMFDDYDFEHPHVVTYGSSRDYSVQASRLFTALRTLDDTDITEIFAQVPSENGLGLAIANRIKKAAGSNIVDLGKTQ